MHSRTIDVVTDWETVATPAGYEGLRQLADQEFSGAVSAGTAWAFFLNGRIVGVFEGEIKDFEAADATAYRAVDPSLPLLFAMQERGGETRANYYTNETPLRDVDQTLTSGGFTGYVELSENVLSGDYYVVYHGGKSTSAAFVGSSERLVTGEEAFETAADEVGIYEVVDVGVDLVDIPEPAVDEGEDGTDADGTGAAAAVGAGGAESADAPDSAESDGVGAPADGADSDTPDAAPAVGSDPEPEPAEAGAEHPVDDATDRRPGGGDAAAGPESEPGRDAEPDPDPDTGAEAGVDTAVESDPAGGGEESPAGEADAATADPVADDATDAEPAVGDATDAEPAVGDATDAEPVVGDATDAEPVVGDATDAEPVVGDATDAEPAVGDATDAEPVVGDATDAEPAVGDATDADPAVGDATDAESTVPDAGAETGSETNRADAGDSRPAPGDADGALTDEERWQQARTIPSLDPEESAGGAGEAGSDRDDARERTAQMQRQRRRRRAARDRTASDTARGSAAQKGPAPDSRGSNEEVEKLRQRLSQARNRIESLEAERDDLRSEREELAEERDALRSERAERAERIEELEAECDRLRSEVDRLQSKLADDGPASLESVSPDRALSGTNLFVRYDSKEQATLKHAHEGKASRADVGDNLRLEHHTTFESEGVAVDDRPYEEFLHDSTEYAFSRWVISDLLYEIGGTGNRSELAGVFDAIPDIDRVELYGEVGVETDDGVEQRGFDVVFRDRMGDPLFVADINPSRDATTEAMVGSLVENTHTVATEAETLAAGFYVTESFFEPGALETVANRTGGGFLSRSKKRSFVKLSRKQGYHLCLVEARDGEFHLNVPEL